MRKIRKYEDDFRADEWVEEAESVYKAAHEALAEGDEDKMHQVSSVNGEINLNVSFAVCDWVGLPGNDADGQQKNHTMELYQDPGTSSGDVSTINIFVMS